MHTDFSTDHLKGDANVAAQAVIAAIVSTWSDDLHCPGHRAFQDPNAVDAPHRSEYSGAVLVITYDGGDLYQLLSINSECQNSRDEVLQKIEDSGYEYEHHDNVTLLLYKK